MSRFALPAVLLTLAFNLTACAGMEAGGRSDRIDGRVLTEMDQQLLRERTYKVHIVAPEYYVLEGTFEYSAGAETWNFILESKDTDLSGFTLPPLNPNSGSRIGTRGQVMRGT